MRVWSGKNAKILILFCFALYGAWAEGGTTPALLVQRKEDEFLLPPYLREAEGGFLNMNYHRRKVDQREKRSVKPGEWLEYGDSFQVHERVGVFVQMNENLQWVGGASLEGQIHNGPWNTAKTAFVMSIQRGWMKVWSKQGPFQDSIRINASVGSVHAKNAVFWLLSSRQKTEIYVLEGKVAMLNRNCTAGQYCLVERAHPEELKFSNDWKLAELEARVEGSYPNLVKISRKATEEWENGKSSSFYENLREKGWGKTDRFFPGTSSKK